MSEPNQGVERESILLRILWMVIFAIVWQLAEGVWCSSLSFDSFTLWGTSKCDAACFN